jgi:hypothetical protein
LKDFAFRWQWHDDGETLCGLLRQFKILLAIASAAVRQKLQNLNHQKSDHHLKLSKMSWETPDDEALHNEILREIEDIKQSSTTTTPGFCHFFSIKSNTLYQSSFSFIKQMMNWKRSL